MLCRSGHPALLVQSDPKRPHTATKITTAAALCSSQAGMPSVCMGIAPARLLQVDWSHGEVRHIAPSYVSAANNNDFEASKLSRQQPVDSQPAATRSVSADHVKCVCHVVGHLCWVCTASTRKSGRCTAKVRLCCATTASPAQPAAARKSRDITRH